MSDLNYIIEILLKARDEAGPKIDALKAKIDSLKATNDAEDAEKDLGKAVEDTGRKTDDASKKHERHRSELERSRRVIEDTGRSARNLRENVDDTAKSHGRAADSVGSHTKAQQDFSDALAKVRKNQEDVASGAEDLRKRTSELRVAWSDFERDLNQGSFTRGEAARGLKEFSGEFTNLSKKLERGGEDWKETEAVLDRIASKLKNPDLSATGGLARSLLRSVTGGSEGRKNALGEVFESIDAHIGDLGVRITGVSSALRGFFDLAKIGLSQQLITGVLSLAGGLISVGSAAAQAGAALAGVFISGLGQAIPMLSIVIAAAERFKNILQAVSVAGQAEQQHFYDPTEKQVLQLQQTSQLISSQQQLSNSYIQLYEAQQRVKDSQIALTEARYTASRQTKELALAEKDAKLEAEGANLGLIEARRQLQIDIQKGTGGGAALQQAELAVKEAELSKQKAEFAIPKAEREERLARQRRIAGEPSVISAREGLEGSRIAVIQAKQAGEAAERQEEITKLQEAARSSKETTYESQLKFLKKGMSSTELGLTDALIGIEKELKSPDSPLKKITNYLVEPFTNAVETIRSLLKNTKFLEPIDELAKSMGAGLGRLEKATYGKEGTSFFETMAKDATKNIPIVSQAIERIMKLFEDIAKAADPAFHRLSQDWDRFWGSLDKKYEGEGLKRLEEFFNKSAEYAEKFGKLGSALFGLFKSIGSDAAPQGLDTVTSLTGAIKDATNWVDNHRSVVVNFFKEAREGLGLIASTLFQIGKQMLEVFSLDSLRALSSFLKEVLLPGLRLVVNILGKLTTVVLDFFNLLGKPGRDILGVIGGIIVALVGISKIITPVKTAITLVKGLRAAVLALKAGESIVGIWNALAGAFDKTASSAAAAKTEVEGLTAAEEANAGAAGADTTAQEGLAGAEAGAGTAAKGGILGGVAGLASKAFLPAAIGTGLYLTRPAGQETGPSGLLTGSTGYFGETQREYGKLLGDIGHFNIGGAIGQSAGLVENLFGAGSSENSNESKLRNFGNEVEKLRGKLSSLPKFKLEEVQHEAESLAQNPALEKYKGSLEQVSKAFNPSEVAAKKWSENLKEYMDGLNPVVHSVAESFKSINESTQFIFKQVKETVKTNIESIKEDLGLNSRLGKEALAKNFGEAETSIYQAIGKGTVTTQKGMQEIRRLVSEALKKYGVSDSEVEGSRNAPYNIPTPHPKSGVFGPPSAGAFASGGYIPARSGGRFARVGEGGHDEVVLTTDPRHADRQRQLLGRYFNAAPHMAQGGPVGYESPFHGAINWGRSDQGTDVNLTTGSPITAVGEAEIKGIIPNWFQGEPFIWYKLLNGIDAGKYIYVAEQINKLAKVGQILKAGQPVAYYAPTGTGIETGWATAGGQTLARSTTGYQEGEATPAGKAFTDFLHGLITGKVIAGEIGQAASQIMSPKVKGGGAIGRVVQNALNLATKAANIFVGKHMTSGIPNMSGSAGIVGAGWSGSWVHIMEQIAKAKNWSLGAWKAVVNRESGGHPGIMNSIGAFGLGQFLPMNYGKYGPGSRPGSTADQQIESMAEYMEQRYHDPEEALKHEEAYGWYGLGGIVTDSIRRLAVRHLRKKVLKFADGGRAPWGGRPVPIIAHEEERVLNPAQYHETARLAGTSPHGLDSHLGFNSSHPRQHFAIGGKVAYPTVVNPGGTAQLSTSSSPIQGILNQLSSFMPLMNEPGSNEYTKNIVKLFKAISEGFKKLKSAGITNGKYAEEISKFIQSIIEETSGILAKIREGREVIKARRGAQKVEVGFSDVVANRGVRGTAGGRGIIDLERERTVRLGQGGEGAIEQAESQALTAEGKELAKESSTIDSLMSHVRSGLASANKMSTKTSTDRSRKNSTINSLKKQHDELVKRQKELFEEMSSNIENRYQAETQTIQDRLAEVNNTYQVISQEQTASISSAQSLGQFGKVSSIEQQARQSAENQIKSVEPILKQAEAIGNRELANTIKQEIINLRQTITNSIVESLAAAHQAVEQASSVAEAKETASLSIQQSYGNLSVIGGIYEGIKNIAEKKYHEVGALLLNAESNGDPAEITALKQEMASLETTIWTSVANKISNARTMIERESGLSESKTSMLQSYSKIAAQEGKFVEAGKFEKEALESRGQNLLSVKSSDEKLKSEAEHYGDTGEVIALTEALNKNSTEIAENNLALKENAVVTREMVINQIEATGQFKTGIYSAATQGLETLGNITGFHNVAGLLGAAKGRGGSLGVERTELEREAGGMGLGVEGMSPAQILTYLASPEGQMKLSQLEKHEDKSEKEQLYKLVNALETNATATLKNSEEIAKLNGQLNQPQSFSTQAWNQFRTAIFSGMGELNPSYSSALPPGSVPTEMPKYGEMAPGASHGASRRASPLIENLSLTHPVERLNPSLLGEELSHAVATTPSMVS